jgi:Flp pilus assembly protein CpaB
MALYGAIALAVIAATFAFFALRATGGGGGSAAVTRVDVVVASQAIGQGDEITADKLRIAALPSDAVINNGLTSTEGVVDVGLVALYPVEEGQQVTQNSFGEPCVVGRGRICVEPNHVAVPVGVNEETVFSGLLAPGDRVDVIAIVDRTVGGDDVPTSVTIVQNVRVVAVGEEQLDGIAATDSGGNPDVVTTTDDDIEAQPDARSVTLEVLPEDAGRVFLAQEEGSIWLAVRAAGDNEIRPTNDARLFPDTESDGSSSSGGDGG